MADVRDILAPLAGRQSAAVVAAAAGLSKTHMHDVMSGRRRLTPAVAARLRLAVARISREQRDGGAVAAACYRATLALAALASGVAPELAQVSDPALRRTADAEWAAAAVARRLAIYCMNTTLGFRQVDVARCAGVTKQAVNSAVREVEIDRDRPETEAVLQRLEAWLMGGAA